MQFALKPSQGVLKKADLLSLTEDARRLFRKHLPVRDVRKDRQVEAEKDAKYAAAKIEQDAKEAKQFFSHFYW